MKRVLVVGDAISDVYSEFQYRKACPDAPDTPVAVRAGRELRPGGAANVAVNLAALAPDIAVDLISIIGIEAARATKLIGSNRVAMDHSVLVESAQSLVKERVLIDGMDADQRSFVARLDNRRRVEQADVEVLAENLDRYLREHSDVDLIMLSDYDGGVLTEDVLDLLLRFRDRLIVDTKRPDLSCFSNGDRWPFSGVPSERSLFVKLNSEEHRRALTHDAIPERHFKYFVVTRGGGDLTMTLYRDLGGDLDGLATFGAMTQTLRLRAFRDVNVVDVCGCGDTFLAGIAAGLLRYDDPFEAVAFANAAAATVVSQPRTAVASLDMTLELMRRTVSTL